LRDELSLAAAKLIYQWLPLPTPTEVQLYSAIRISAQIKLIEPPGRRERDEILGRVTSIAIGSLPRLGAGAEELVRDEKRRRRITNAVTEAADDVYDLYASVQNAIQAGDIFGPAASGTQAIGAQVERDVQRWRALAAIAAAVAAGLAVLGIGAWAVGAVDLWTGVSFAASSPLGCWWAYRRVDPFDHA